MIQEIKATTWDGKPFTADIISLSGEVAKVNRTVTTQTNVTGGGGTVSSSPTPVYTHPAYSGFNKTKVKIDPVKVSTTTTLHDDIFLIDKDGKEHLIQFKNKEEFGIRDGHQIQLLSIVGERDDKQINLQYIAFKNISLDKEFYDRDKAIKIVTGFATYFQIRKYVYQNLPQPQKIALWVTVCVAIGTLMAGVGFVLLIAIFIFFNMQVAKIRKNNVKIYETEVWPALKNAMQ